MKTYYWDFFGPNAEGTAAHFGRHLEEFFAKHGIEGCELDTMSAGEESGIRVSVFRSADDLQVRIRLGSHPVVGFGIVRWV